MSTTALHAVEQTLRKATQALTVTAIASKAGVLEGDAGAALRQLAQAGQIELIPGGRAGNRYAWLSTVPVMPKAGTAVKQNTTAPVAVTTPEPTTDEIDALEKALRLPAPIVVHQDDGSGIGPYLLRIPKRKPRIINDADKARSAALAAIRNGAARADVFSLSPVGTARRGAEWADSK